MSAFGNYEKDMIVEAVETYVANNENMDLTELHRNIMEAFSYALHNIVSNKVDELKHTDKYLMGD